MKYPISTEESVTIAYVLIKSDLGAEEKVIEELEKLEQVQRVERTFGGYDMVVKMESEHIEKISDHYFSYGAFSRRKRGGLFLLFVDKLVNTSFLF